MLPATHRGGGTSVGVPDVCLTPSSTGSTSITYTNTAQQSQATGCSNVVMIASQNAVHKGASISSSSGDDAGTSHWSNRGTQSYTTGNTTVYIEGQAAITLTSVTSHNKGNCPLGAVTSPSSSMVFFTRRAAGMKTALELGLELDSTELRQFGDDVAGESGVRWMEERPDRATLRIERFGTTVGTELRAALEPMVTPELRHLTLDLRGNPGGCLGAIRDAMGVFIGPNQPAACVRFRSGFSSFLRTRGQRAFGGKLSILVNSETASAAEIFTDALQARGRAVIRGGPTFGKRTVHVLRPSPSRAGGAHYERIGTIAAIT